MSQNKATETVTEQSNRMSVARSRLQHAEHLLSLKGRQSPSEAELRKAHADLNKSIDSFNQRNHGGTLIQMMKVARLRLKKMLPDATTQVVETTS